MATAAWAHVEVSADKPQAGATNVTITFTGEAESSTAGLKSARVVLPDGIAPAQVKLAKAPAGWTFSQLADGFQVSGKALPVGKNAVWAILVDKLPDSATELPFKTVETYGDGQIANWIEVPEPGQTDLPDPAPVLTISPAPGATIPASSASPSGVAIATSTAAASSGNSGLLWTVVGVVAAILIIGGLMMWARRRRDAGPTGRNQ